ncbi:uncharacterized protein LOC135137205 [Zophobas morio]|uniref:uncharacterized protein LOC135137205 n=1 Tax=Zophobas morio TaxID=2755281 RepID=UPI00308282D8
MPRAQQRKSRRRERSPSRDERRHRRSRSDGTGITVARVAGPSGGDTSTRRDRSCDASRGSDARGSTGGTSSQGMADIDAAIVKGIHQLVQQCRLPSPRSSVSTTAADKIIPEFDPREQSIAEWIAAVDEYAYIHHWDDKRVSHFALGKLRGPAEIWYRSLPTRLFSWPEWREMLISNFKRKRKLHEALTTMLARVPLVSETLYEYVFHKLALIQKLKISLTGEDVIDRIMGGIDDDQIKFSVETAGITEPAVLANHLRTFDAKHKRDRSTLKIDPTKKPKLDVKSQPQPSSSKYAASTSAAAITQHSETRSVCYYCRKSGHFARNCPEKRTTRLSRPNRSNAEKSHKPLLALEYKHVNFATHGGTSAKYFKDILINKSVNPCFIDFGSQCSLISEATAKTLNLTLQKPDMPIVLSTLGNHLW